MIDRIELERIIADARANGLRPDLRYADLRDADLRGADLRDADLRAANLWDADLRGANLWDANLRAANLWGANLRAANLWGANLRAADLRNADLGGADLGGANLRNADLRNADLQNTDLRNADLRNTNPWGGMPIQAGASGNGYLVPTPDGWRITIGCWRDKTLDDLRDLIEDRVEWPEARGKERERRRPMLRAVLALCEAHIGQQPESIITDLATKWRES